MMTTPPASFTSTAPAAPSEPEPVRITAIRCSPYACAALDKSISTDGLGRSAWSPSRCTWPSLILTCRLAGTTYILPLSKGVGAGSLTTTIGKVLRRSRLDPRGLGGCGSRCWARTIGAGNDLLSVLTNVERAPTPPAEEPTTTRSSLRELDSGELVILI